MNNQELTKKVRELKELQIMASELEAEITNIQDVIKAEMSAQNVDELQVDVFKVRWTTVISNRFDTATFKKNCTNLYNQFTRQVETKRFQIV